jgi:hypothetical protein
MLRFHNAVIADVTVDLGPGFTAEEIFAEPQRIVRWHYRGSWCEFLPHTVRQPVTTSSPTGRGFYRWRNDPFIPVEFSVAAVSATRGAAQLPPTSAARPTPPTSSSPCCSTPPRPPKDQPTCAAAGARHDAIDWQIFFDGDAVRPNKIDTTLSRCCSRCSARRRDPRPRWHPNLLRNDHGRAIRAAGRP